MEVGEECGDVGTVRRTTRQTTKKNVEPVQPVEPEPKPPKRERNKRKKESSSENRKPSRKRRSKNSNNDKVSAAPEIAAESGNGELKQSSWSSGFTASDDEDLPSVLLVSPAKPSGERTYKKHDIVWIKRDGAYRPSLITRVKKNIASFKFVNETRSHKYIWKTKLDKIIPFDDPDKNIELLNEGRRKFPRILDAYNRVKHYLCRLSEQENLSPLKYLLPVTTGDLLYGIVPELEQMEGGDTEGSEEEFDRPILDLGESDSDENEDEENKENDLESSKEEDQPKEKTIYDKISDEDKAKISEKIKALLEIIQSEDCFNYLKQLVEEPGENVRMKLLKEMDEAQLMYKSGLGPFFVAERLETDQLTDILDDYAKKLNFCGDVSLLQRHVLQPEAIVFALQTLCKLEREPAETFFMKWTFQIPEWVET